MSVIPMRPALKQSVTRPEFLLYGELNGVDVCRPFWWDAVPSRDQVFADLEKGLYRDRDGARRVIAERNRAAFPATWETVVAYRPLLAELLGIDPVTNLFLCQVIHWDTLTDGEVFFHTREQWQADTGLTYPQQQRARKRLGRDGLGILEEEPGGRLNRILYRLNRERLREHLESKAPGLLNEIMPTLAGQLNENLSSSWNESSQQLAGKSPTEEIYEERKEEIPPPTTPRAGGGREKNEDGLERKTSRSLPERDGDPSRRPSLLIADIPALYRDSDMEVYSPGSDIDEWERRLNLWEEWLKRHGLHDKTHDALVPYVTAFGISDDSAVRLCDRLVRGLNERQLDWLDVWAEEAVEIMQLRSETNPMYYFKVLKHSFDENVSPLKRDNLTR